MSPTIAMQRMIVASCQFSIAAASIVSESHISPIRYPDIPIRPVGVLTHSVVRLAAQLQEA